LFGFHPTVVLLFGSSRVGFIPALFASPFGLVSEQFASREGRAGLSP
jgi:hypothetical protein